MNLRQALLPIGAVALLVTALFASDQALDGNCGELVDSLGTFSTSSSFSFLGAGALSVTDFQNVGPRFTLTETTVITEIGAIANSTLPLTVDIYGSLNGVPDISNVLGSFVLSNDDDPAVFSYESVQPNLVLGPGEYFALFAPQPGDAGSILQTHSGLQAESFS